MRDALLPCVFARRARNKYTRSPYPPPNSQPTLTTASNPAPKTNTKPKKQIFGIFNSLGNIGFAYSSAIVLMEIEDTLREPPRAAVSMKKTVMAGCVLGGGVGRCGGVVCVVFFLVGWFSRSVVLPAKPFEKLTRTNHNAPNDNPPPYATNNNLYTTASASRFSSTS
jgi:hypothetical protein